MSIVEAEQPLEIAEDRPSVFALRDEYIRLTALRDACYKRFNTRLDQDGEKKDQLYRLDAEYFALPEGHPQKGMGATEYVRQSGFDPEICDMIDDFELYDLQTRGCRDELNILYGEELEEYAQVTTIDLLNRVDYQALDEVHALFRPNDQPGVKTPSEDGLSQGNTLLKLAPHKVVERVNSELTDSVQRVQNTSPDFVAAEQSIDTVDMAIEVLERWGVLHSEAVSGNWARNGGLSPAAGDLREVDSLKTWYKTGHELMQKDGWMPDARLGRLYAKGLLPVHEWALRIDTDEVEKWRAQMLETDIEVELERISFEIENGHFFSIDEEEVKDHIREHIPPIALEGVKTIAVRRKDQDQIDLDLDSNLIGLARHVHDNYTNDAEIVIWLDPIETMAKTDGPSRAKDEFYEALDHEFGHAFSTVLPVWLLRRWHDAVRNDPARVTPYVAHNYEINNIDRYAEDLADTFRMKIHRPSTLRGLSASRYWEMYDLFGMTKPGHKTVMEYFAEAQNLPADADPLPNNDFYNQQTS